MKIERKLPLDPAKVFKSIDSKFEFYSKHRRYFSDTIKYDWTDCIEKIIEEFNCLNGITDMDNDTAIDVIIDIVVKSLYNSLKLSKSINLQLSQCSETAKVTIPWLEVNLTSAEYSRKDVVVFTNQLNCEYNNILGMILNSKTIYDQFNIESLIIKTIYICAYIVENEQIYHNRIYDKLYDIIDNNNRYPSENKILRDNVGDDIRIAGIGEVFKIAHIDHDNNRYILFKIFDLPRTYVDMHSELHIYDHIVNTNNHYGTILPLSECMIYTQLCGSYVYIPTIEEMSKYDYFSIGNRILREMSLNMGNRHNSYKPYMWTSTKVYEYNHLAINDYGACEVININNFALPSLFIQVDANKI